MTAAATYMHVCHVNLTSLKRGIYPKQRLAVRIAPLHSFGNKQFKDITLKQQPWRWGLQWTPGDLCKVLEDSSHLVYLEKYFKRNIRWRLNVTCHFNERKMHQLSQYSVSMNTHWNWSNLWIYIIYASFRVNYGLHYIIAKSKIYRSHSYTIIFQRLCFYAFMQASFAQ